MSEKSKLMEEHIIVPGEKQSVILPNDVKVMSLEDMHPSAFILKLSDTTNNNKEMGKLFNKDGKLFFEGNADESARILFECVINHYDVHIKKLDAIIAEKNQEIELLKAESILKDPTNWC